ncbi:isochorismate synthase MenF [Enterobacillus tribolii]|nr:isochorismate synthase MenF [Enterobacillus tribolii]
MNPFLCRLPLRVARRRQTERVFSEVAVVVQIPVLIARAIPLLHQAAADKPGLVRVSVPCSLRDGALLLDWLAAQPLYPQFYWRQRDGSEEAAVCGSVRTFRDSRQARDFIREHNEPELRIWGLNAFDQMTLEAFGTLDSLLFVPRIALIRHAGNAELVVYLCSDTSLRDDLPLALAALESLCAAQPLPVLRANVTDVHHQPEKEAWCDLLRQALDAIARKAFEKVVLARRTTLTLDAPLNAAQFLAASRQVNHRCYHFMLALAPEQAFLGSSPERLYRRHHLTLETEALAGTVGSGENDAQAQENARWLMNDGKNQHENLLVVDDICQRLQGGAETLDVMPAEIVRLRKVQHLRRPIHATLLQEDDADCLLRLQPTAAVAGLPREPARRFIRDEEPFERGWYAGTAGYLSLHRAEFCVALRSALIQERQIHLYAGAGIVAGSDPQEEWLEIESKAAGLRTLLDNDAG